MGVLPSDSSASGNITIIAGSSTQDGTIQILTRATSQTSVSVQTGATNWSVIYSYGQANRVEGTTATTLPLEMVVTAQSVYFPLPFLASLVNNSDVAWQYIGQEILEGSSAQHIRARNTSSSVPALQFLASFTVTDIWIDAATYLPRQISFVRHSGGGTAPKILVTVSYANFQPRGGVLYPLQIEEALNGTAWATITIQSVTVNTGLTDSNFPVSQGGN